MDGYWDEIGRTTPAWCLLVFIGLMVTNAVVLESSVLKIEIT